MFMYDCMLLLYLFACVRRIALSHVRFNLVVAVYVNKLLKLLLNTGTFNRERRGGERGCKFAAPPPYPPT